MRTENFQDVINKSADLAKQMQVIFPDARDAIMCLCMILAGLAKSAGIPLSSIVLLLNAMHKDMDDMDNADEHNMH